MISAIILARGEGPPPDRVRELVARSLAWLVSAVVEGVVRDVTVACPPGWPLVDVLDHAGCALVAADGESERLARAVAVAKCARVLVIGVGYQPEGPLVAEIDARERHEPAAPALLLAAPATLVQRLFPDRAPVVGLLLSRNRLEPSISTFTAVARTARGAARLRTRLVPVL